MIPAICLANYRITYVEYYTPDKPGPLHQRIKAVKAKSVYMKPSAVTYVDMYGNNKAIRSPYIKIEEIVKK